MKIFFFFIFSILKPEASLVRPEDLADIEDSNIKSSASNTKPDVETTVSDSNSPDSKGNEETLDQKLKPAPPLPDEPEPYAHLICERYGHTEAKERFKPNKPLKPFTGSYPLKPTGRVSTKPKRWEETNVTPPIALHPDTKLLSIEESLDLQRDQNQKLKVLLCINTLLHLNKIIHFNIFFASWHL